MSCRRQGESETRGMHYRGLWGFVLRAVVDSEGFGGISQVTLQLLCWVVRYCVK